MLVVAIGSHVAPSAQGFRHGLGGIPFGPRTDSTIVGLPISPRTLTIGLKGRNCASGRLRFPDRLGFADGHAPAVRTVAVGGSSNRSDSYAGFLFPRLVILVGVFSATKCRGDRRYQTHDDRKGEDEGQAVDE
jgi:hypothetical protein